MSGNNNNGFFGAIQHGVNSLIYSLTTNDRYASFDSPYKSSPSSGRRTSTTNDSQVSLVDNTGSNRSSVSNGRPFQYRPGLRSQLQNNASGDLQLQDYINGQPPLPSLDSIWERLEAFLEREYPELYDNLGEPATVADLNEFENDLECTLPSDVRESFRIHDGQENKSSGLLFGLNLLELEYVTEEWSIWMKVSKRLEKLQFLQQKKQAEASQGSPSSSTSNNKAQEVPKNRRPVDFISKQRSIPEGAIQPVYAHPQWIPLARDYGGNNIAVDLAPGPNGRWGQIILFGRDFDTKYVVANSWTEFLLSVVEDYEDGKYMVDPVNETICFYENNRPVDYLRVLVHRAWAPLKKAKADEQKELLANTTALRSKNNSTVDLPKETLITPLASTTDLSKVALDNSEFKLEEEEEEEEDTTEAAVETPKVTEPTKEEALPEVPEPVKESEKESEVAKPKEEESKKEAEVAKPKDEESEKEAEVENTKEEESTKEELEGDDETEIPEPAKELTDENSEVAETTKEEESPEEEKKEEKVETDAAVTLEDSTVDIVKEVDDVKEKMEEVAL